MVNEKMFVLAQAIERRVLEIWDGDGDTREEHADSKDLGRALARLISGQSLHSAFGSPGDWGYETPIGKALAAVYSEINASEVVLING